MKNHSVILITAVCIISVSCFVISNDVIYASYKFEQIQDVECETLSHNMSIKQFLARRHLSKRNFGFKCTFSSGDIYFK